MSHTVWKYRVPELQRFSLRMPIGARPLTVQVQGPDVQMWALVDPDAPAESREFVVVGTGFEPMTDVGQHVGTFQLHGGALVFHVFEVKP